MSKKSRRRQVKALCGDHCKSKSFDGWYGKNVRLWNSTDNHEYECVNCGTIVPETKLRLTHTPPVKGGFTF